MGKMRGATGAVVLEAEPLTPAEVATSPGPGVIGTLGAGVRIGPFRGRGYNEDPYLYALALYEGVTSATNHEIPLRVERTSGSWVRFKKILLYGGIAVGDYVWPYVGICDGNSNADFQPIGEAKLATVVGEPFLWEIESPVFWTPPLNQADFDGLTSLGAMVGSTVETGSNLRTSICFAFSATTILTQLYVEFEHAHKGSIGSD